MGSAITQLLLLQASPPTEYRAKRVRLKVILIALLLIRLDFKVLEGELSITRSATIQLVLLQAFLVALSTMKPALHLRLYNSFLIGQFFAKLSLD